MRIDSQSGVHEACDVRVQEDAPFCLSSFLITIGLLSLKLLRKEIKKGLRIVARNQVICTILVYIPPRRNRDHGQIIQNALQFLNGVPKRRAVNFGMDYRQINVWESTQKFCTAGFGVGGDYIMACSLQAAGLLPFGVSRGWFSKAFSAGRVPFALGGA